MDTLPYCNSEVKDTGQKETGQAKLNCQLILELECMYLLCICNNKCLHTLPASLKLASSSKSGAT